MLFGSSSIRQQLVGVVVSTSVDGRIRITKEDGWILIRESGIEQKVRCTAEGRTKEMLIAVGYNQKSGA